MLDVSAAHMHIRELVITTASISRFDSYNKPSRSKPTGLPGELDPVSGLQNVNDFMPELQRVHLVACISHAPKRDGPGRW
jgi:hypothetical protein